MYTGRNAPSKFNIDIVAPIAESRDSLVHHQREENQDEA